MKPLIVAITGASGSALARLAVDRLLDIKVPVELVCSTAGRLVWAEEMDESFGSALERWQASPDFNHYGIGQINARIASGSFPTQGMLIIPCSMNTVASISHGISENLIQRCANTINRIRIRSFEHSINNRRLTNPILNLSFSS